MEKSSRFWTKSGSLALQRRSAAKREYHIRWNYSVEKEEQDYLVYITGEWEEMKIPLTIRISPLVYDAAKAGKTGAAVCIF